MKQGYIENNGNKLYYEIEGVGETIVFLHGFSLDHTMWSGQVEFFKNKYQIVTYDMRGFGKSSQVVGNYSHHDDLKVLLNNLGISRCYVVGLSLGGEVAIDFTLTNQNMVKSLVLVDSSIGGYKSTVDWNIHNEQGSEKAKENWINHDVFKSIKENKSAFPKFKEIADRYSGWHWLNEDPREKLNPTALERLEEIEVPTLIIVGEKDLSYYHDLANILNSKTQNSKKIVFPEVGHMVNLENPDKFNETLFDFLNSQKD